ncbi:MAG TPA: isochorismatase family cysteine hydrolase [Trebonia sp.]|nr:isochorismatase family cysteine hydrolase [Trebonia sp.]
MSRALIVVDMQNGFCHPEGSLPSLGLGLAGTDAAVRGTATAVAQARDAGVPVVFTRHQYRPGRADEGQRLTELSRGLAEVGSLAAGSWDAAVIDDLGARPDDLYIDKVRFDAFLWTSLDPLLRGLAVDSLAVCGVVTNICVESTVRAAFMRDYRVTLLADCCAARTPRLHDLGVEVMASCGFASVANVGEGTGGGFHVGRSPWPEPAPVPAAPQAVA